MEEDKGGAEWLGYTLDSGYSGWLDRRFREEGRVAGVLVAGSFRLRRFGPDSPFLGVGRRNSVQVPMPFRVRMVLEFFKGSVVSMPLRVPRGMPRSCGRRDLPGGR